MARVMINCPTTGKPLPTGISIDQASWEDPTNTFGRSTVGPCPHCGETHAWSKDDGAYLEA